MARVVIADAGPLIAFASINRLDVLQGLFSRIRIAESVRNECLIAEGMDAQRIAGGIQDGWLVVATGESELLPLPPSLGLGESDSMRLALKAPDISLLIMDDRLARRHALSKGLSIVGSVRLLDIAQGRGLIPSAEECIRQMTDVGYRVSIDLLQQIRKSGSESMCDI